MVKKLAVSLFVFLMFPSISHAESVYAYRAWVGGSMLSVIEHTYGCVDGASDCYSFPLGTNKSVGSPAGSGWAWRATAACHASCAMTYGIDGAGNWNGNGVCHQNTNRMLYLTGAKIPNTVVGYVAFSRARFGVTGNKQGPVEGRFQACWQSCGGLSTLATD